MKIASYEDSPVLTKAFCIGTAVYMLHILVWVYLLKYLKLSTVGVLYSITTVLFMTVLGVFVFHEPIGNYELIGVALAIASIVLILGFG